MLDKISEMLNKDFDTTTKKDIEELITKIDDNGFKEWTKHGYRVCIKKFYTWYYNKDNEDIDNWETPSIVKWIKIKAPRTSKKLPSELITPSHIRLLI
jgi:site-specific recombinase XerD